MSKIIGIDLGTTNSVVAVMEGGEPKVIANAEGSRTTPSVVAFTKSGERLVGQVAKRQAVTNPEEHRLLDQALHGPPLRGGQRRDEDGALQGRSAPTTATCASTIDGKQYSPPEISAMILQKLKQAAEDYLGEKVTEAVITVPAYFNDAQRQATKDAGKIAGLEVERLVNEPTAAALAYGLDKKKDETIAVYDFGGGTFDISILEVGDGVVEVKSTNGDTHLGGDNIDQRIIDWILAEFKKDQGIDLSRDPMALQRLKEARREGQDRALDGAGDRDQPAVHHRRRRPVPSTSTLKLTRAKLEQLVDDIIKRSVGPCKQALKDAGRRGRRRSTRWCWSAARRACRRSRSWSRSSSARSPTRASTRTRWWRSAPPSRAACSPATSRTCCCSTSPRCRSASRRCGGVMTKLIERNTTIPTRKSEIFSTAADNQT